jgi:hypothetical protein
MKIFIVILILFSLISCNDTEENIDVNSEEYKKGQEIAEQLNEEMESIDWEENYDNASEKGKEAAEYLNSLFGGN